MKLKLALAAALVAAFAGCGKNKSTQTAQIISALTREQNSSFAFQQVREAQGQAYLAMFASQREPGAEPGNRESATYRESVENLDCTPSGASGDWTYSCTTTNDYSAECKGKTYTLHKGGTFVVGIKAVDALYRISFDMNATVTGGDFSSAAFACKMAFTFNPADPAASPTMDCTDFNCKVGEDSFSCEDLKSGMESEDSACRA